MNPITLVELVRENIAAPYNITSAIVDENPDAPRIILEVRDLSEYEPAQRGESSAWDSATERWLTTRWTGLTARTRGVGHDIEIDADGTLAHKKACPKKLVAAVQAALALALAEKAA